MEILLNEKYSVNLEIKGNRKEIVVFDNKLTKVNFGKVNKIQLLITIIELEKRIEIEYNSKKLNNWATRKVNLKEVPSEIDLFYGVMQLIQDDLKEC